MRLTVTLLLLVVLATPVYPVSRVRSRSLPVPLDRRSVPSLRFLVEREVCTQTSPVYLRTTLQVARARNRNLEARLEELTTNVRPLLTENRLFRATIAELMDSISGLRDSMDELDLTLRRGGDRDCCGVQ